MPTFVLPATRVTLSNEFEPIAVTADSFGLLAQAGVSTLTYSYTETPGTQAVISSALDFAGVVIDGEVFQDQSLNLFVEETRWTQGGATFESLMMALGADTDPATAFIVYLGGDPLPAFEDVSDFNQFIQEIVSSQRLPDTNPLGPGQPLSLTTLPGLTTLEGDYVRGTDDADARLFGSEGNDYISGFAGDDFIDSFSGNDTIFAGDGDDLIVFNTGNHVVDGGAGFDRIRLEPWPAQIIDVTFTGAPGGNAFVIEGANPTSDTFTPLFTVTATNVEQFWNELEREDSLLHVTGDAGNNSVYLEFLPSTFVYQAEGGTDELILGETTEFGSEGFSFASFVADVQLSGNEANLRVRFSDGKVAEIFDVERFVFTDGAFTATDLLVSDGGTPSTADDLLTGTVGDDLITALEGSDRVEARAGNDMVFGNQGWDTLLGQDGDDRLDGGLDNDSVSGGNGADTLFGGGGYDTLRGGAGDDRVVGGDGRDLAYLGGGDDLFIDNAQGGVNGRDTVYANAGNDTVGGGAGNDVFNGQDGNDRLLGRLGNDKLFGGNQNDTMVGGDGNDTVAGGNGRDRAFMGNGNDSWFDNDQVAFGDDSVVGGAGNDTIRMGGGNDTASGGAGADQFVFSAAINADVISDYETGTDALHIDATLWGGALDQTRLDALSDTSSGDLVLDFGGGNSITFAGLTDNTGLLGDIVLV